MASAWSEPTLIRLASGFEAAADVRRRPRFLRTFNPDSASHGHNSNAMDALAARSTSSVLQRHAAKLDPFLVPRLRRLMYL